MDFTQILLISYLALFKWSSNYLSDNYFFLFKSKTPLQATGYQICSAASSGVFDPRGSRQISMQAWLLGSLLAGINGSLPVEKVLNQQKKTMFPDLF